jgi:hypothetical protein
MRVLVLLSLALTFAARGEVPNYAPDELAKLATSIIVGQVTDRSIVLDTSDPNWDGRSFTYTLKIHDVEKGDLKRGDVVECAAWRKAFIGPPDEVPTYSAGHRGLPLEGEVARFYLQEDGAIILPNGVELPDGVDASDPTRRGDAPPALPEVEPEPPAKDPFGWDVMLILLALPLFIGGFRQPGLARWGLVGTACVMLGIAAFITVFYR